MVPVVELRGAIPVGVVLGLDVIPACLTAVVGNMLPVPFIYLFARKVLVWGSTKKFTGGFFSFFLKKGENGGKKLMEKAGNGSFWALAIFVGIPLPGTGAWTGTLAASILDMGFKKSIIACVVGVAIAGVIISVLSALGLAALIGLNIA